MNDNQHAGQGRRELGHGARMTPDMQRSGIVLVAVVAALGCGGSLPDKGGPVGSGGGGGGGGGGGSPAACCPNGGQSLASVVRARGFTAYEGRPVKAVFFYSTFSMPDGSTTHETSVSGGAFDLAFPPDSPTCAESFWANGAGAIYIDTDGDGICDPSVDYVYAWKALGAAGSTCATIDLTPQSPSCGGVMESVDSMVLVAARVVCPATQGCLTCPSSSQDGGLIVICLA